MKPPPLITINRPKQDWGIFLGDVTAATAILDRFLAHATFIQMVGKSYRRYRCSTATDAQYRTRHHLLHDAYA